MVVAFWDWHGWDALVALGTLALAAATAFLAWKTKGLAATTEREVRAVEDQVAVARESLDATVRPILMEATEAQALLEGGAPFEFTVSSAAAVVVLWLRNAGEGIAFVRSALLSWEDGGQGGRLSAGAVPRDDLLRVTFVTEATDDDFGALSTADKLSIEVAYSDLGGSLWASQAVVRRDPATGARVLSGIVVDRRGKTGYVGWSGRLA